MSNTISLEQRTCKNCRNEGTQTIACSEWHRQGRDFLKRKGYPRKKSYCKSWAYKPTGMWERPK